MGLSVATHVMIFSMSEQLASWAPGLYREAKEKDVLKGRLASVMHDHGAAELVMKKGSGFYVVFAAFGIEHIVGLVVFMLALVIPRCPEWVSDEIRRTAWYKENSAKNSR